MAKKGEVSFSELKKKIQKNSTLGNHTEMFNTDYSFIHSGNYMYNALLSSSLLGGYPENRIISLSGDKGVGKTFLILNSIREFQKSGYCVKFYDSEGAINRQLANQFGIDTSEEVFDYSSVSTVEDFRTDVTNYIQELLDLKRAGHTIPKMLFILDSAGNLASTKEVNDAISGSDKTDMTRAKILKSVFRIITSKLAEIGATLIFTNHTYRTTDLFSKEVSSGGSGPAYAASIMVFLSKAQLKTTDGKEKLGVIVSAKTEKNRFARPELIKFHIDFNKGMNPFVGLHEYISWTNCGIENGTIISEKEFTKFEQKNSGKQNEVIDDVKKTKYDLENEIFYFVKRDYMKTFGLTGVNKFAVKHLADSVDLKDLFTDTVFTRDVLQLLQDNVIHKIFAYNSASASGFDDILDSTDDEDVLDYSNNMDVDFVS